MPKLTLTENRIKELKRCIEDGNYTNTCLDCLNIPESTFYGWIRRANHPDATKLHKKLATTIKKARGRAVREWLKPIRKAADEGNWQAAAWYLERTNPKYFGRVNRVEMDSKSELKVIKEDERVKAILEDPELSQIATELLTKLNIEPEED